MKKFLSKQQTQNVSDVSSLYNQGQALRGSLINTQAVVSKVFENQNHKLNSSNNDLWSETGRKTENMP